MMYAFSLFYFIFIVIFIMAKSVIVPGKSMVRIVIPCVPGEAHGEAGCPHASHGHCRADLAVQSWRGQ